MRLPDVFVARLLQGVLVTHLAACKGIAADEVQRIAIRQLSASQCLDLIRCRLQFELGGDELTHTEQRTEVPQIYQCV
jgi:hypothetical protein